VSSLEQEARKYTQVKKKKLSAADQSKLRVYMASCLGGLLSTGRVLRRDEAIREAYNVAIQCLEFEKDNF